jgi:hypothetical protein
MRFEGYGDPEAYNKKDFDSQVVEPLQLENKWPGDWTESERKEFLFQIIHDHDQPNKLYPTAKDLANGNCNHVPRPSKL